MKARGLAQWQIKPYQKFISDAVRTEASLSNGVSAWTNEQEVLGSVGSWSIGLTYFPADMPNYPRTSPTFSIALAIP